MKKLAAVMAAVMMVCSVAQANVVTFYGWITSVNGTSPLMKVGDDVEILIHYNPTGGAINRATVTVNESSLNLVRGNDQSHVYIDNNPLPDDPNTGRGIVQWTVQDGRAFSVDVATNTYNGVFPCIDDYDLGRNGQLFFNGVIASFQVNAQPHVRSGN